MASTLLKLRNPRWGTPKWFDEFREGLEGDPGDLRQNCGVDHVRGFKAIAILQPYEATGDGLLKLLSACHAQDLKVFFTGKTNHYPSATFTIVIYRPEDERDAKEFAQLYETTDIEVPEGL